MKKILSLLVLIVGTIIFSEPLITATFYNSQLTEALNEVAMQAEVTILTDEYVNGIISADFTDTPVASVLTTLLMPGGFSFKKINDKTYFVGLADPRSKTFSYLAEKKFIKLNYISPEDFIKLVPDSFLSYIKINYIDNGLIFYAPEEKIKYLTEIIKEVDKPQTDIKLNIYVLEVDKQYSSLLSGNLSTINQNLGDSFSYTNQTVSFSVNNLFQAQLKMFESENLANLVSNQSVYIKPGKTLNINILNNKNIVMNIDGKDSIKTVNNGISISILPTYYNKKIDLEISSEISKLLGVSGNSYDTTKSILQTKVSLNPNEMIMIANLDMNQFSDTKSGFPLLREIPILRFLFSNNLNSEGNKRLMIFVNAVGGEIK
ncbi:general secretion pathway protein GspD [Tepiditoga spiralis]|uniref:General secretion pathway protein GspD n=1 Tax=Tepiditoga spiralis TaxID=2108365 RepID=A0A7G1G617_9BACT|nr:hypothetical protein [Tepiditoga spiralis]BBE30786.1 general secretion pathway protein GspD [Tepiditoga spiralis]